MGFSTFPNNPFPPSTAQFNEVKNELATKTNLSNIAPTFDATSGVYAIGDKVIYDGVLYEFTSPHATAGEWDESEAQPVKVSELINSLESGLTSKCDNEQQNVPGLGMVIPIKNGYDPENQYANQQLAYIRLDGTNHVMYLYDYNNQYIGHIPYTAS